MSNLPVSASSSASNMQTSARTLYGNLSGNYAGDSLLSSVDTQDAVRLPLTLGASVQYDQRGRKSMGDTAALLASMVTLLGTISEADFTDEFFEKTGLPFSNTDARSRMAELIKESLKSNFEVANGPLKTDSYEIPEEVKHLYSLTADDQADTDDEKTEFGLIKDSTWKLHKGDKLTMPLLVTINDTSFTVLFEFVA